MLCHFVHFCFDFENQKNDSFSVALLDILCQLIYCKGCFVLNLTNTNINTSSLTGPIAPGQASRVYIEEGFAFLPYSTIPNNCAGTLIYLGIFSNNFIK